MLLFAIGFFSLLGQVVLLRELTVASYGNDLVLAFSIGGWMFWSAVGVLTGRVLRPLVHRPRREPGAPSGAAASGPALPSWARRKEPRVATRASVSALVLAVSALLPLALVFVRGSHRILGGVPGAFLTPGRQWIAITMALLPVAAVLGLLFQWAAERYVSTGRSLARAYAIESSGGACGGLFASIALSCGMSVLLQALIGSLGAALLVLAERRPLRPRLVAGFLAALYLLALGSAHRLDFWLTRWNHPGLVAVADTPYCRVAVTSMADQVTVYTDNALAYETEGHEAAGLVHTTALQVDAPRRILVLGGGAAGLVREALKHHPEEVTYVDVDRRLLELVIPRLPDDDQASLRSGTVQIVIADPRRFLDRAGRYDVILLGMPEPSSGQAGRYYSREFFRQCAAHLAPGGALGFRMRSSENLWNQVQAMRAASVFHALESAFPDVLVLPASESVFLASNAPLRRDPAVSIERLECRGIESPLVTAPFLRYLYTNDRGPQIARRIAELPAIVHTDGRPIGYQLSQILWLSQFFPSLGTASPALSGLTQDRIAAGDQGGRRVRSNRAWRAFLAVLALMLAFAGSVVFRRRGLARRIVLVGSAATIAMVLESVLILRYQVHRGILFRDIGTLLTLTMIGLAAGAGGVDRLTASGSEASHRRSGPRTISLLTGGLAILAALVGVSAALPATHGLVATGIGLFLTGALVSAIFAQATRTQTEDPTRVIAPLYAADLCGGCIGSIAAAVVLIPDLGFGPTSWIMTVLALGSVILSLGSTGRALPAP